VPLEDKYSALKGEIIAKCITQCYKAVRV
jgi:hypothetical protein